MRETFSEWECMPGSASGFIESMDAAGFDAGVESSNIERPSAAEALAFVAQNDDFVPCLDVRHLQAPEPLERAMAAADALPAGARLEVWTPMLPIPLLQLLEARGFMACAELQNDGTARIFIGRGND
jgi:hypothetical protein